MQELRRRRRVVVLLATLLTAVAECSPRDAGAQDPEDPAVTLAVIGDFGSHNTGAERVAALVSSFRPDHVLTVGDNLYSTPPEYRGTDMFDLSVGRYYCEFLRGAAPGPECPSGGDSPLNRFFPATGNHDYSDAGMDIYTDYFDLPGDGVTSATETGSELYYDVVLGPVHAFVIDTEGAFRDQGFLEEQREWLEGAVRASESPWQVVVLHDPPYSSGSESGSTPEFQWPYALWGVDLVLAGHEHSYERVERDGITYVVNGLGGASRYPFAEVPISGSVTRFNEDEGALRLRASPSALTLEMVTVDGQVVDAADIEPADPPLVTSFQQGVSPTPHYGGSHDATIREADPRFNDGSAPNLVVDGDDPPGTDQDAAALMSWDVSLLPPGSTVVSAWIHVEVTNPAAEQDYDVHSLTTTWDENTVTWSEAADGEPWEQPGATGVADRGPRPVGTLSARIEGRSTLALDATGLAALQASVDGTAPVTGFVLSSSRNSDGVEVHSADSPEAELRPVLEVAYRPPSGPYVEPRSRLAAVGEGDGGVELAAAGGTGPYTWRIVGDAPEGLAVSDDGVVSASEGAPSQDLEVVVTDATGATSPPTQVSVLVERAGDLPASGSKASRWLRAENALYLVPALVLLGAAAAAILRRARESRRPSDRAA